ncbi:MAG: hypothetical protein JWM13_2538 [Arthrobacter sp.]|nr:hypothetical protein [Arthrobacter sp.]
MQNVLIEFGFSLQSMDGHHEKVTKTKLEDSRVSDAEEPDWVALVELKGYTKGARTNDVTQILGRPMRALFCRHPGFRCVGRREDGLPGVVKDHVGGHNPVGLGNLVQSGTILRGQEL